MGFCRFQIRRGRMGAVCIAAFAVACAPQPEAPTPPERTAAEGPVAITPSPIFARFLDRTTAEPGSPRAGLWIETTAVTREAQGWATDLETGRSVRLLLQPRAEDGGFDRISVEALRELGVSSARLVILTLHRDIRTLPR